MSIPYLPLHAKASEYKPDMSSKKSSTWVAILVHSIKDISEITDNSYFMWIKCHGRITVRTLKYEYFSRHPLERLELKFWDVFPDETTSVMILRDHQRKKRHDDKIIVLRAFHEKDVEREEELDEEIKEQEETAKLIALVQAQVEHGGQNGNAIVLYDSDDEPAEVTTGRAGNSRITLEPDDSDDDSDIQMTHKTATLEEPVLQDYEIEDGDDEAAHVADQRDDSDETSSNSQSTSVGNATIHGDDSHEQASTPGYNSTMTNGFVDNFFEDISGETAELPALAEEPEVANPGMTQCDCCGKQMFVKPWTQYVRGENCPLCTGCSRTALQATCDDDGLLELNFAVEEELNEKESRPDYQPQSMDEDAPLDYPHDLLTAEEMGYRTIDAEIANETWIPGEQHSDPLGQLWDLDLANASFDSNASANYSVSSSSAASMQSCGPATPSGDFGGFMNGTGPFQAQNVGELQRQLEEYDMAPTNGDLWASGAFGDMDEF